MYSIIAVASRVPRPDLSLVGPSKALTKVSTSQFLPSSGDLKELTDNLLVLVERVLTKYIHDLSFLSDVVPQHIPHQYSAEMSLKSETAVIDVMMKNEACHDDMQDIMRQMQGYLGNNVPNDFRIVSGLLHAGLRCRITKIEIYQVPWLRGSARSCHIIIIFSIL